MALKLSVFSFAAKQRRIAPHQKVAGIDVKHLGRWLTLTAGLRKLAESVTIKRHHFIIIVAGMKATRIRYSLFNSLVATDKIMLKHEVFIYKCRYTW